MFNWQPKGFTIDVMQSIRRLGYEVTGATLYHDLSEATGKDQPIARIYYHLNILQRHEFVNSTPLDHTGKNRFFLTAKGHSFLDYPPPLKEKKPWYSRLFKLLK